MSLLLLGAGPGGDAPPPAPELNPDPNFALGTTGWAKSTTTGTITVNTGSAVFTDTDNTDRFNGASTNGAALIAAIPNSTALVVRVTASGVSGTLRCVLKNGTSVALSSVGGGVYQGTVTSGTSTTVSATKLTGDDPDFFSGTVTLWSIKAS